MLLISTVCLSVICHAQLAERTLISSNGWSFTNPSFSVDYSVGEVVIETFTTSSFSLLQGFHQPPIVINPGIIEPILEPILTLYPNPTRGNISVSLGNVTGPVLIDIYNVLGQVVYSQQLIADDQANLTYEMNLHYLATGTYHLRLRSDSGRQNTAFIKVTM